MVRKRSLYELTPREDEVLRLVRLGLTNGEIADRLGITEAGVKYHVSEILSKLGVSTREEAAALTLGATPRRWWTFAVWKAAAVAVVAVAVGGLGILAWGVFGTESDDAVQPPPANGEPPGGSPHPGVPGGSHWLVYVDPGAGYEDAGRIWISGVDGSQPRPVTPDNVTATFAGLAGRDMYYVAFEGTHDRMLRRIDIDAGDDTEVHAFQAYWEHEGFAAVTPDGRYAIVANDDSMDLLDVTSGSVQRLLTGNGAACEASAIDCVVYRRAQWSPDSTLLLVQKGFYEGAHFVLVDPFAEPHELLEFDQMSGAWLAGWSPAGDAVCMAGQYAAPSALYIAAAPDWGVRQFFPEFEEPSLVWESVEGCAWTPDARVAAVTALYSPPPLDGSPPPMPRLLTVDPVGGVTTTVWSGTDERPMYAHLVGGPGGPAVVIHPLPADSGAPRQPLTVDLATGDSAPVLSPGSRVVAIVPAPARGDTSSGIGPLPSPAPGFTWFITPEHWQLAVPVDIAVQVPEDWIRWPHLTFIPPDTEYRFPYSPVPRLSILRCASVSELFFCLRGLTTSSA